MANHTASKLLRARGGHGEQGAKVTNAELFFDLIYAFAVTQISHHLLTELTPTGALEALLLWFAVWLGWQYTCWVTNWFDPDTAPIRLLLFGVMLVGLLMAAVIPQAFGERGWVFAGCYALMQVGRTAYVLFHLGANHALTPNFRRILGWNCIAAAFWIAGGSVDGHTSRIALWTIGIACEYVSPMFGFALPGLGRSRTSDWTIDGGHLAERCQLFVLLALGESIIVTGSTISAATPWNAPILIAALAAFVGSVAMWWMYFNTSSRDATQVIEHAADPGRVGAHFHYLHVLIIAGIIVAAVADDLVIAHPEGHVAMKTLAVLIGGPAIYLFGNGMFKRIIYGRFPLSHAVGLGGLAVLTPFAGSSAVLWVGAITTTLMVVVATWESISRRRGGLGHARKF